MKRILLTILSLIIISSCGNKKKENEEQNDWSKVTVYGVDNKEYEMRTATTSDRHKWIQDVISYDILQKACNNASARAQSQVKNRRTYKPNTSEVIWFDGDGNDNDTLELRFSFIAANAYGVEDDLICIFYFDKNGNEIKSSIF